MTRELRAFEAPPSDRVRATSWLAERGVHWPPGRTFVASAGSEWLALARLGDPPPGDGLHREHVRTLDLAGSDEGLAAAASAAAAAVRPDVRLEAEQPATSAAAIAALESAGLAVEGRWPGGWRTDAATCDLVVLGREAPERRPAGGRRPAPWARDAAPAGARGRLDVRIERSTPALRPALRAFLEGLVPGRAYPAGALLSEAERAETRRRGDLEADWRLALTPDGAVAGGLVLERDARPERAHVRRVHLDVIPGARGRGVAASLLRAALSDPPPGVARLEADPREGNAGACGALERAGFALAGAQAGAWRMRLATARDGGPTCWDEDVRLYAADVTPPRAKARPGPSGRGES
jgi:RimJ/RimL family protein N-acetyltransferase